MTDLRQAAQMALEAWDDPMKDLKDMCVAMDALRAALEQQQAEPVAFVNADNLQGLTLGHYGYAEIYTDESAGRVPLYTTPPQQQAEPVGWLDGNDKLAEFMHRDLKAEHDKRGSATPRDFTVPVYAAPPQRKPLTDEQIIDAMHEDGCERIENFYVVGPVQKAAVFSFARAVEAKIKEGT